MVAPKEGFAFNIFFPTKKGFFARIFAYNHNLIKVCIECDCTHLQHNLLMSQKNWSPKA
jgi:hypothetical protein